MERVQAPRPTSDLLSTLSQLSPKQVASVQDADLAIAEGAESEEPAQAPVEEAPAEDPRS